MANLQVKNVPEALHQQIRAHAKRKGRTVRDIVIDALTRELRREEFRARLSTRVPVELGRPAARTVDEVRDERDAELAR